MAGYRPKEEACTWLSKHAQGEDNRTRFLILRPPHLFSQDFNTSGAAGFWAHIRTFGAVLPS